MKGKFGIQFFFTLQLIVCAVNTALSGLIHRMDYDASYLVHDDSIQWMIKVEQINPNYNYDPSIIFEDTPIKHTSQRSVKAVIPENPFNRFRNKSKKKRRNEKE